MPAAAALVVQVLVEALPVPAELPVLAVVDLAHLPVLARRAHREPFPLQPRLPVLARAHLLVLVPPVLVGLPVLADLVVAPEVPVHLLSRQSFSAARARSSP